MSINFYLNEVAWTLEKLQRYCLHDNLKPVDQPQDDFYDFQIQSETNIEVRRTKLYQMLFIDFFKLGKCAFKQNIKSFKGCMHNLDAEARQYLNYIVNKIKVIGEWLAQNINLFKDVSVVRFGDSFCTYEYSYDIKVYLIIRSGIQFMIDLLANVDESLDKLFDKLGNGIYNLDQEIENILSNGNFFIEDESSLLLVIPREHKWWPIF